MWSDVILSLSFLLLAAISNGFTDIINDHFPRSIFQKVRNDRLRRWLASDWRDHYIDGDPTKGVVPLFKHLFDWEAPGKLGRLPCPAPFWDGWHFFKALMLLFLYLSIAVWLPLPIYLSIIIMMLVWFVGFNGVYEWVGRLKEHRRNYWKTIWGL